MAFFLGNVLELLKDSGDVGHGGVGYFVLEVEIDAFCGWYGNGVFALIFLY